MSFGIQIRFESRNSWQHSGKDGATSVTTTLTPGHTCELRPVCGNICSLLYVGGNALPCAGGHTACPPGQRTLSYTSALLIYSYATNWPQI